LADKSTAITFARAIFPSQQPSKACANDRGNELVAMLVTFDHSRSFLFTEKAMGCDKMSPSYGYFFIRLSLNVPKPIGIRTEAVCYDYLGTFFPVLDDFEYGLPPETGAASGMRQQQEAFSKELVQMPAVNGEWNTKQIPQYRLFSDLNHLKFKSAPFATAHIYADK
jgi:hypothetical protein